MQSTNALKAGYEFNYTDIEAALIDVVS
ncbi:DUF1731 domain-containing protein [Shewanella algicola]|nr:DUF1731 domain-containing protein [Shewanella algicola]